MEQIETVLISKDFDAPVEKVWDAWADPNKLAAWWCTDDIKEMIITEYDFRPGGVWRQHAISNDGYAIGEGGPGVVFDDIAPLEKIVTRPLPAQGESVSLVPGLEQSIISFKPIGAGKTELAIKHVRIGTDDWEPNEILRSTYEQIFDNLAAYLNR